jgi:hypothetical protein
MKKKILIRIRLPFIDSEHIFHFQADPDTTIIQTTRQNDFGYIERYSHLNSLPFSLLERLQQQRPVMRHLDLQLNPPSGISNFLEYIYILKMINIKENNPENIRNKKHSIISTQLLKMTGVK